MCKLNIAQQFRFYALIMQTAYRINQNELNRNQSTAGAGAVVTQAARLSHGLQAGVPGWAALFSNPEFEQALSGHLPGDAFSLQRAKPLAHTLRELSKLSP